MTRKLLAVAVLCGGPMLAQYQYFFSDQFASNQTLKYNEVNSSVLSFVPYYGLTSTDQSGGSLIFANAITPPLGSGYQTLPNNYEVKATLTLNQSAGVFITYLRASPNAKSGPGIQGTFYSVEISNPSFNGTSCSATLLIVKSINGNFTVPVQSVVPCHNGMVVRSVYTQNFGINVYIDNVWYAQWIDNSNPITTGQPGIGVRGTWGSNYVASVSFGALDTQPPNAVSASSIGTSAFSTSPSKSEIDMQWQPPQRRYTLGHRCGALLDCA